MDMIYMCIKDALDLVCHENCCYFFFFIFRQIEKESCVIYYN